MNQLTQAQKESINIFLTEKFLRECWHKTNFGQTCCKKCGKNNDPRYFDFDVENQDLFTPTGFFILWEKAQKEEWWKAFKIRYGCWSKDADMWVLPEERINHLIFPTLLAEFMGWKE